MVVITEYLAANGGNVYRKWFHTLDVAAATRVSVALERMTQGNTSSMKAVGMGVSEYRIDFGPGYRIYFGHDGAELVILLGGGSKKQQGEDIEAAKAAWSEYKMRKRAELAAQKASAKAGKPRRH